MTLTAYDFNGVHITPMDRERDLAHVMSLSDEGFNVLGDYQNTITDWVLRPEVATLVARREQAIDGFITYAYIDDGEMTRGEIIALAVASARRGRGIGRMLMNRAIDALDEGAEALGLQGIYLTVAEGNTAAHPLFNALQFYPCGQDGVYPNGQRAVRMKRRNS